MDNTMELKFRAWDKTTNEMIISGMAYRSRLLGLDGTSHAIINGQEDYDGFGFTAEEMKFFDIMQYTNKKDKTGVEIYAGDIVEVYMGHYNQPSLLDKLEVVWGGPLNYAAFGLTGKRCTHKQCYLTSKLDVEYTWDLLTPQLSRDCEIIGNIYE